MKNYIKKMFDDNPCAKWFAATIGIIWFVAIASMLNAPTPICVASSLTGVFTGIFGIITFVATCED